MNGDRVTARLGEQHQTLRGAIVDALRELIIDGTLPQGSRLVEHDLAGQLAVSRIPLREAILQLEAEGLVRKLPRRGSVVATLTPKDVAELLDVREALEPLAAGRAAEHATEADLAVLHRHVERAMLAADEGRTGAVARLNVDFHSEILRAADNALLTTIMAPLRGRSRWLFRLLTASTDDPTVLCREHSAIYDAVAARDRPRAERLTREHVASTRAPTLRLLQSLTAAPVSEILTAEK